MNLEDFDRHMKEALGDAYTTQKEKAEESNPTQSTQGMDEMSFGVIMIPRRGKRPKQRD
mgnify:CR=1 FL=1|tara:strand:- start:305 stop:481 length:177 start_codon:yes stop_codon:yes gene_type:complete